MKLTCENNHQTIITKVGNEIAIELTENPTTGFLWTLEQTNNEKIQLLDTSFTISHEHLDGAGGLRRFSIKLRKEGQYIVKLNLRKPWEKGSEPCSTFSVLLQVHD